MLPSEHPQVKLYNPLAEDFSIPYDINEDGMPITFTLHAGEIEPFPAPVAEHIKKHLANKIAFTTKGSRGWEEAYDKAIKKIEVDEL